MPEALGQEDADALLGLCADLWDEITNDKQTKKLPVTVKLRMFQSLVKTISEEYVRHRATYLADERPIPPGNIQPRRSI